MSLVFHILQDVSQNDKGIIDRMSIPIGTNSYSNMKSNANSDYARTPFPALAEQLAPMGRIIAH